MRSQILTFAVLALLAGTPVLAGEHDHGKSNGKGHGRIWCPHCGEACYPTVTKGKETKVCFETECKPICIPKVRFPWEKDCGKGAKGGKDIHGSGKCAHGKHGCARCPEVNCVTPKCGRTKYVNVLLKHEYECTVCKYSWDPGKFEGDSKYNKQDAGPAEVGEPPAAEVGDPVVPVPPPVEARRRANSTNVQPVRLERAAVPAQPASTTSSRRSLKVFSTFFK